MVLAADLNNIRDQLNATAPATLTTQGDIVIASGANALARLAKSTTSTQYLANTGSSNAPAWNEVALDTGVSATLPVGNGGTGATTLTDGGILLGSSTSAVTAMSVLADGEFVVGNGTTDPVAESGATARASLGITFGVANGNVIIADSTGLPVIDGSQLTGRTGGLVFIGTVVASDDATITVDGLDTSGYDSFMVQISGIRPETDDTIIYLRLGDSSGIDSGASDYSWVVAQSSTGGTYNDSGDSSDSEIQLSDANLQAIGNASGEGFSATLTIHTGGTINTSVSGTGIAIGTAGVNTRRNFAGQRLTPLVLTQVQLLQSSGNLDTGRMTVYGVVHS